MDVSAFRPTASINVRGFDPIRHLPIDAAAPRPQTIDRTGPVLGRPVLRHLSLALDAAEPDLEPDNPPTLGVDEIRRRRVIDSPRLRAGALTANRDRATRGNGALRALLWAHPVRFGVDPVAWLHGQSSKSIQMGNAGFS
jgi:hypothetical protein